MPLKAHVQKGEDATFQQQGDFYKFLQIGTIVRVDNERNVVDIQFVSNPLVTRNVPITAPFFTGRSFIGGMPEEGSAVICGYIKLTNKIGTPLILAYLDKQYFNAISYAYTSGKTSNDILELTSIHDKIGWAVRRLKRRKLYPGDINFESTQGSELLLDDSVFLSDSKMNEILISSSDRTVYTNSINNFLYTNAGRILNGLIVRQNSPFLQPILLDNGQNYYLVSDGSNSENGKTFTEMRTELREIGSSVLDVIKSFDDDDYSNSSPDGKLLVIQVFGTVVGNDRKKIEHYGQILRPQIFSSHDNNYVVQDIVCKPSEYYNLASAYQMKFASGAKFDIDKEGHTFMYLPASSLAHPLGGGRSLEFAADGSIKIVLGKNTTGEKSLELFTKGRSIIHFGFDSNSLSSLDWVLDRAMYTKVIAPDKEGFAVKNDFNGHMYEKVRGDKTLDVDGSYHIIVKGKIQEDIHGAKVENYINDKMTNYGGDYQEIVTKQRQSKYGEGHIIDIATKGQELTIVEGSLKETLTLGNKEVKLIAGDSTETLLLGSKKTSLIAGDFKESLLKGNKETSIVLGDHKLDVTTGNISQSIKLGDNKEDIASGNKKISIKVGNFEVSVTSGNVVVKTATGKVDITASTQKATIVGMMGVEIKSAAKVVINAPMVEIGGTPAKGGVVTGLPGVPSHMDYITGAPLKGSATVKATI
jgi:hypothetical protein